MIVKLRQKIRDNKKKFKKNKKALTKGITDSFILKQEHTQEVLAFMQDQIEEAKEDLQLSHKRINAERSDLQI